MSHSFCKKFAATIEDGSGREDRGLRCKERGQMRTVAALITRRAVDAHFAETL